MDLQMRVPVRSGPDWSVWRGEQAGTRRLYLVKEANPTSPYLAQLAARLRDEYRFLSPLDHPNLVKPVWVDDAGHRAAFGDAQCSLTNYLDAHGPVAPTLVANVLAMAADALDYLHARRLGHGCVNAHTLLVGPAGEVKFGDFLGYEFNSTAPLPVPDPEPRYQAPEIIDTSLGKPGPAADLYCLGFLALELLSGEKFEKLFGVPDGANWLAWHADPYKQLTDWQPRLGHAPAGLLEVVAGLIAKRPTERTYQTAAHLKATLVRARLTSDARLPPYRPPGIDVPSGKVVSIRRPPARERTGTLPKGSSVKPALHLVPVTGGPEPKPFSPGACVLLGRGRDVAVDCPGEGVSRKHALLACGPDGAWRVYDLNSAAGTFVNGTPVGKSRLFPEDELYVGECGFRVELAYTPTGRTFDQFRLLGELHRGRRGRVYRAAWAAKGGRATAVRISPKGFQFDPDGLRRLLRGVPETARIKHPHLVQAFRGGTEQYGHDRVWFLAMEYAAGGSLRDRLEARGRLAVPAALRMAREAATGVAALAEVGWVHRNINPGCVLFADDGTAKVGDFFFARAAVDPSNRDASMTGDPDNGPDPAYQAPECLAGESRLTPACDVYSLGATLYQALTGRPPFDPNLPAGELTRQVMTREPAHPRAVNSAIPGPVADLVCRALAKDAGARYAGPVEFAHAAAEAELAG